MSTPVEFEAVLNAELQQIEDRRHKRNLADHSCAADGSVATPSLEQVRKKAHLMQLVGLAFSGGGIRSATFNLGILQGLASLGLPKYVDYLSTVSGGGYIGGCWTAWIQRRAQLEPTVASASEEVEKCLKPKQEQASVPPQLSLESACPPAGCRDCASPVSAHHVCVLPAR